MVLFVVAIAFCNEMANGANFALVPHCNSYSNGTMSGLVGAMGNLGGIFAALVWRFHSAKGDAWWYVATLFSLKSDTNDERGTVS